jgi:hypothetical protein
MDEAISPQKTRSTMNFDFTLDDSAIAVLRNRHEVGLKWIFDLVLDENDDPIPNKNTEFPGELECWRGTATVFAQGPVENDSAKIGFILHPPLEGARTFAELDIAVEKIVRAELSRAGIVAGETESRPRFSSEDFSLVVPVTIGTETVG